MARDLVIIGCGGHGREVADIVDAINSSSGCEPPWNLVGFIDDSPSQVDIERAERRASRVLGPLDEVATQLPETSYVVGIGTGHIRQSVAHRAGSAGLLAATLVHPSVSVGSDVSIGEGVILCAGVTVTTNITIGNHVHINRNSTIGHDCVLDDFATINPLVAISGNCQIGAFANLGTHSAVLPGIAVGESAVVGAGSCVTKDVAERAIVKGVPAR